MAKFGFSPLERAAQSARDDILQRSENLAEAARRQREENVYYRNKPMWHIALYAAGIVLLALFCRYLPVLEQLVPAALDALKGILPAGFLAKYGSWVLDNLPWFHEKLYPQVSQAMATLLLLVGGGFLLHGIVCLLVSSGCTKFITKLENTGAEMQRRMNSVEEIKARLKQETASGTKSLKSMNNIRTEAEALIRESDRIIKRNLTLKKVELLVLTALSAALMLYTLIDLHLMVLELNLQGRNEALLVTVVTIATLAFYMCFIGKRLYFHFPRLGKWILRLILAVYALWLNAELILVHKQGVDMLAFFKLSVLPIPENIYALITNYAGPVLLSYMEIGSALGIANTTNAAAELKADREGIVIPMTDGSKRITKAAVARRLGITTVIRPTIVALVGASLISFLFCTAVTDSSYLALAVMGLFVVLIAVIMSIQGLSTDRFEMKYKRKGAKLQGMFVLLFFLLVFAMSPGDSFVIFSDTVATEMAEAQEQAKEDIKTRSLSEQMNEKLNNTKNAPRFSVDYAIVDAETGELFANDYFGASRTDITVDKERQLAMQVFYSGPNNDLPHIEIQDYSWPIEGMEQYGAYTTWAYTEDSDRYVGYLNPDGSWSDQKLPKGQWVQYIYYGFADSYANGWSDMCSFSMLSNSVTAIEELGTETVDGITATHYLVKAKIQRFGLDQYDNYGNIIATYDTARDYYTAIIPAAVQERYPELCESFMEIATRAYEEPSEFHLWFDEADRLIRLEQDWTYMFYQNTFGWGDAYAFSQLQKYGLTPVSNVQIYHYDDLVRPIPEIPADVKVLD